MERRFVWFADVLKDKEHEFHKLRDAAAMAELSAVLHRCGFEYDGLISNTIEEANDIELAADPYSDVDLVVMTTRIPLDTKSETRIKPLEVTNNWVEREFSRRLRKVFSVCSRQIVTLNGNITIDDQDLADRRHIEFRVKSEGGIDPPIYRRLSGADVEIKATCGYLLYLPRLLPKDTAGLIAFGMSGVATLVWCAVLRKHFSRMLDGILSRDVAHFLMAEFPFGTFQEPFSTKSLPFAKATVVSDTPLQ